MAAVSGDNFAGWLDAPERRTRKRRLDHVEDEGEGPATRAHGNEPAPSRAPTSFEPSRLTS